MAVDPKLLEVKPVNQLAIAVDPFDAQLLLYDNSTELKRYSLNSLKSEISTGIKGEALPTSSPTPWTSGDPDLYEKYDVKTAGTYVNFLISPGNPIVVTAEDLADNYVQIWVKNGLSQKVLSAKPELTAEQIFDPNDNINSSTMKATADRYDSTVNRVNSIVKVESSDVTDYKEFTLFAGSAANTGYINTSVNQLHARITDFEAGKLLHIVGYGNPVSITNGTTPRIVFYSSTTPSQATFISFLNHTSTSTESFTPPSGTQLIVLNIDSAVNVGASPSTSPYNSSFKIYEEIEGVDTVFLDPSKIKTTDRIETEQLLNIESAVEYAKNYKYYDGLGYPQYEVGNNGDKYFDKSSGRIFIKNRGLWEGYSTARNIPFTIPAEYGWTPSYRIYQQDTGKFFLDWKGLFVEKVKADFDSMTKYYVDNVNGSDSNNGLTKQTAVKSISYARDTLGARNIIIAPGIYWFNEHFKIFTDNAAAPLILRCIEGMATFMHAHKASMYTWTSNTGCYQAARSNVVDCLDLTNIGKNGEYLNLKKVSSISECQSTVNSWYTDNTTLYIHTIDGRVPDQNIAISFESYNGYTSGVNVPYVYFENITSYLVSGGQSFLFKSGTTTQHNTSVFLKNVHAIGNSKGNGIAIDNVKFAILEGCTGGNHLRDALNYHTSLLTSGYIPMKVMEIDCYGYNTGVGSTEVSSNGSTTHEGITILRINTVVDKAMGSVIADVNNGARSLNLGVTATNTILSDDSSFRINGTDSKMWIYYGTAYSDLAGTKSIGADTGAFAYYDKNTYIPNGTRGTVSEL